MSLVGSISLTTCSTKIDFIISICLHKPNLLKVKLENALACLVREDPSLRVSVDDDTGAVTHLIYMYSFKECY